MKIIQLVNCDGDHAGLYTTERTDEDVDSDFQGAFHHAKEISEENEDVDVHETADEYLEEKKIFRILADEVYVTEI